MCTFSLRQHHVARLHCIFALTDAIPSRQGNYLILINIFGTCSLREPHQRVSFIIFYYDNLNTHLIIQFLINLDKLT